jgi:hypothetical protein
MGVIVARRLERMEDMDEGRFLTLKVLTALSKTLPDPNTYNDDMTELPICGDTGERCRFDKAKVWIRRKGKSCSEYVWVYKGCIVTDLGNIE